MSYRISIYDQLRWGVGVAKVGMGQKGGYFQECLFVDSNGCVLGERGVVLGNEREGIHVD